MTDRGPRGRDDNGKDKQAFAVPEYTPMILHVRVQSDGGVYSVELLETIPIVGQSGRPVTGMPNLDGRDERPVDFGPRRSSITTRAASIPRGWSVPRTATSGSSRSTGRRWCIWTRAGKVTEAIRPGRHRADGADYPVAVALPGIFVKRSDGQGFEGLTASPDGGTLYLAMQGPLSNPNDDTGDRSRKTRILAFDVASRAGHGEYVYQFELVRALDPSKKADPEDMKLSALAMCDDGQLLVLERTPDAWRASIWPTMTEPPTSWARVWDESTMQPSLEAAKSLAADGILPLAKTLAST